MGCFDQDLDDLFAYNTLKVVRIRDRRLGLLHYTFLIGILIYVIGITIIFNKRYLLLEQPVGSIRLSLLKPDNGTGTGPSGVGWLPRDLQNLTYCSQTQPNSNKFKNYPCQYWDESVVLYPKVEQSALHATSRLKMTKKTLSNCNENVTLPTCNYAPVPGEPAPTAFVADIESFTVMFDHSVYATRIKVQRNAAAMPGTFLADDGSELTLAHPCPVCRFGVTGQTDVVSIADLLRSAGVDSLDAPGGLNGTQSIRYDGGVFLVVIEYSNTKSFDLNDIRYTMRVSQVANSDFKAIENVYSSFPQNATEINRHGVRLIILQTGLLGKFDFQTLLINLITGLGLITVASTIVDLVATKIMPERQDYQKAKFDVTEDFSDLRMSRSVSGDKHPKYKNPAQRQSSAHEELVNQA
eukprot:Colp12_sorted_trinity150504_noHs@25248